MVELGGNNEQHDRQNDDEEAAELLATIRGEHVPMKKWYNTSQDDPTLTDLRRRFGPSYPDFWQDVVKWDGWKDVRKAYLSHTEGGVGGAGGGQQQPAPRKRRSRWATGAGGGDGRGNGDQQQQQEDPPKRRSRWARGRDETPRPDPAAAGTPATSANPADPIAAALSAAMSAPPKPSSSSSGGIYGPASATTTTPSNGVLEILPGLPSNLTREQMEELTNLQRRLRIANEKLENLEVEAARVDALPRGHPDRSPSPPPVYGADGVRKNTRAVRWKERYGNERQDCLEKMMDLNPALRPPGFVKRRRTRKIYIPVEEHPTYNFIGLIIGPRGKTQKEMEAKTGCKIAIRGKGSVKEGARGRRDGKLMDGDDEPLHVVITGDDQASVDEAARMIEGMLVVIDDDKNVHKQQQLRELALLNGTLKDDDYCLLCAERGHRQFECPKRFAMNKAAVAVKCAICGDTSHPTRDCTQKQGEQQDEKQLDTDYMSFMAELDGKKVPPPPAATTTTPDGVTAAAANSAEGQVKGTVTLGQPNGGGKSPEKGDPSASGITGLANNIPTGLPPPPLTVPPGTTSLPPPPVGIPPPPIGGVGVPPPNFQAPPGLPPPPMNLPPPPGGAPPPLSGVPTAPPGLPPPPPSNGAMASNQGQEGANGASSAGGSGGDASTPAMPPSAPGNGVPPPPPPSNLPPPPPPPAPSTSLPPPPPYQNGPPGQGGYYSGPPSQPPPPPPPPQQPYQQGFNNGFGQQGGPYGNGGGYQQQGNMPPSGGGAYGNHYQQGQGYQQDAQYQQQQAPPQQQQQQQGRGRKNQHAEDETEGWDYQSYFSTGGDAGGAGGFNWWDNN